MLLIECPHCGPRAQTEFTYGGDASVRRPADPEQVSSEDWLNYVYLRENRRGLHLEWWHHSAGCRSWFKVRRDTLTHEVLASAPAQATLERDEP